MIKDGRSSLQKAAASNNISRSLSIQNGHSRRGNTGRNRMTENSFEIGAPIPREIPVAYTVSNASCTFGEDKEGTVVSLRAHMKDRKTRKNTKHFRIISAHDEQQNDNSYSAMDVDYIDPENSIETSRASSTTKAQTFLQIGGLRKERKIEHTMGIPLASDDKDDRLVEQMEGVIDQGSKMPLVVLDGANVAYAYARAMTGECNSSLEAALSSDYKCKLQPDVRGIQIATDYFLDTGIRALVVLPQYWLHEKNDYRHFTTSISSELKLEILSDLKIKGLIVASPPTDDDDAYALTISRREESRSRNPPRNGEGPGFVLSNDLFRDAIFRDAQERDSPNGTLKEWLTKGRNPIVGPGRISYTFCDMGRINDRGERVLDFIPNPRHSLIIWLENKNNEILS